ncbi:glycosyltransferase family 4 protein [Jiella sonneratiae]|uniref:Glycosyltransferase family 4 protein n=1 Tax=Jiella sonneratiae TaxID=2816856 RepID=A0ABS3J4F3_9HYPH|nr:glycosyltransferase family 1 protein [Jiella sonneratiae]MBO0904564.1 glycosyltransferase family 4 protein [Jiella sonneratiae]
MTAPVLIEGRNLAIRNGTGIASYARNLTDTLRSLGYELDLLFDTEFRLSRDRADWNETRLYDMSLRQSSRITRLQRYRRAFRYLTVPPMALEAREVAETNLIADQSVFPGLHGFGKRMAIEMLFMRADQHLLRYGRRLTVKPLRQPKVFHATHPAAIEVRDCPNLYTVHDLVPLRLPHMTLDNKRAFHKTLSAIAAGADRILTVSESSRRDFLHYFPVEEDRVVNTYQAVSLPAEYLARSAEEKEREVNAFGLTREEYFVFVGALEPKKNLERLIDAYLAAGSHRPLVIVGKLGWGFDAILEKLHRVSDRPPVMPDGSPSPLKERIIHLSYLPFTQVLSLIENARALLFPSLYEGFGLPALEAMLLGAPVISADTSSLPEVVGEAGILVDPYDPVAIARAIRDVDHDADLRAELRHRGPAQAALFSPERFTERMKAIYDRLA